MIQDWLKKNRITVVFTSILLLCLAAGRLLCALFGHQLIRAMYEANSLEVLNRVIVGQAIHPLKYYFKLADMLFIRSNIIFAFSLIYLFSIWSGKHIPKKWFLCLIVIFSLCQMSTFFDFKNMDSLPINDDHPKNYSIAVENANLLLKYGTPFGFNHNFQGGIPAFYLRGCFLELIPFSFFLGDRVGYQAMLIFFIILIPLSIFFLVLELTKNEDIAKLVSFISTFQLWLWLRLHCGITPAIVAVPLSFLSVLFFLRYLYNKKYFLFPLLLLSSLLVYTNPVIFLIISAFFTIIFIYKLITQRQFFTDFKKIIYFVLLNFLICLPFCYNLLNYGSFLRTSSLYFGQKSLFDQMLSIFLNIMRTANLKDILFLSTLFLFIFYFNISRPKEKLIIRNALIFSLIILLLRSLKDMPNADIFIKKIDWFFLPYIAVFNLALFLFLSINKIVKIFGITVLLFIVLNQYPLSNLYLRTVNAVSEIDDEIYAFISPGDYVLFENCAHKDPTRPGVNFDRASYDYGHWLTYLQKDLGVKFFSHIGDDAHSYNNLRHMYITDGLYKGEPLTRDNEKEFIAFLKDWGVNKVCGWSPTAKRFFDKSRCFKLLGKSKRYTCYIATYQILPQVRLNKGGVGRMIEEGPFSFTVYLENVSKKQTVTINKNYFNFWSAYNGKGDKIPIRECNQKICFDIDNNGYVFFKYQKNVLLNLISLLVLFFALVSDISRHSSIFKQKA